MTVQGFTDLGSTNADNLFAGEFPVISELATITGGSYVRGTILKQTADGYTLCGETDTPEAILAETTDASAEDKQAVVYLTGVFNLSALIVANGATVNALKTKLSDKSIFLKTNQSY